MIDKPSLQGLIFASTTKGWTLAQETKCNNIWYVKSSSANQPWKNLHALRTVSNKLKFGHIHLTIQGK